MGYDQLRGGYPNLSHLERELYCVRLIPAGNALSTATVQATRCTINVQKIQFIIALLQHRYFVCIHRRSQDFVWGALPPPQKKVDDLFLVVAFKRHAKTA